MQRCTAPVSASASTSTGGSSGLRGFFSNSFAVVNPMKGSPRRATSIFNPDTPAEDAVPRHPAIDPPAVVADLEALALDRLHQMQVLAATDLAQHDVPDLERRRIDRRHGA